MKTIISFFAINTLIITSVVYADTNVKSKLLIEQNAINPIAEKAENSNHVDFFELAKKNEPPVSTPNYDSSATVNMSEHDRAQYLFNQRNYSELNNQVNMQRVDALRNARDNGDISNKQYQREVQNLKMYNQPKGPNSVGFTIPFE